MHCGMDDLCVGEGATSVPGFGKWFFNNRLRGGSNDRTWLNFLKRGLTRDLVVGDVGLHVLILNGVCVCVQSKLRTFMVVCSRDFFGDKNE